MEKYIENVVVLHLQSCALTPQARWSMYLKFKHHVSISKVGVKFEAGKYRKLGAPEGEGALF